ncbi:MAG: YebC/PmpR family DNA-binding transcriptional regulator, partial [Oscillospiraceae bacterium]|nr:YebC/PmpR family DNA-binding transcriptional regulator [Oscillospiraceae bacterium]
GGPDPDSNSKLKDCIAKAKAANVPNDNIDRIIKRAAGDGDDTKYENIVYEGYGPCGVAVIVEALSDNRNRTAADVRHDFDKFGGNLGTTGCVSFIFNQKGVLIIEREGHEEEKVMEDALEAGAADLQADEDIFEIFTEPEDFSGVLSDLTDKGYEFETAEIQMVPSTYVKVPEKKQASMQKLLDALEDLDDVQNVWHNWDMSDVEDTDE